MEELCLIGATFWNSGDCGRPGEGSKCLRESVGKDRLCAFGVGCLSSMILTGCTGPEPNYCDTHTPCGDGYFCILDTNTCEQKNDLGPPTVDGKVDLVAGDSVAIGDTWSDASVTPADTAPELGQDSSSDALQQGYCGDKTKNGTEECDDQDFGTQSCKALGYTGGVLKCTNSCAFDTSGCYKCGDNNINPGEQCDGQNLAGQTCFSSGFDGGELKCKQDCSGLDTAGCVKHDWVSIIAGTFQMGSPASEPCHNWWENEHSVKLSNNYLIMAKEITQDHFKKLMGYNPSQAISCGLDCPVEWINWHEAAAYCNTLSTYAGRASCYKCSNSGSAVVCSVDPAFDGSSGQDIYDCTGIRLPTDAEWEYACRSGTTTAFYNGGFAGTCNGTDSNADLIGWYDQNSGMQPHPVGKKKSNQCGLYDMSGNVFEWVHDIWQFDLGSVSVVDPWGPTSGSDRTLRGGSWNYTVQYLRSAYRSGRPTGYRDKGGGFRCVRRQ